MKRGKGKAPPLPSCFSSSSLLRASPSYLAGKTTKLQFRAVLGRPQNSRTLITQTATLTNLNNTICKEQKPRNLSFGCRNNYLINS